MNRRKHYPVPATKEGCRQAMAALGEIPVSSASKTVVFMFLQAAARRLPTQLAVDAARIRRRK